MKTCEYIVFPKKCDTCTDQHVEDCPINKIPFFKNRMEALETQRQKYKASSEFKSEFLANVSHEIRTPMNAILGLSYLLCKTQITPEQKNYLEKINAASKTLLGLMNDVLDLSKLEASKMEIKWDQIELIPLIEEVVSIIRWGVEEKRLRLLSHVHSGVPVKIRMDPVRLKQILLNLLSNAMKFTEKGEILLLVKKVGEYLIFEVKDSGFGISTENQKKLFEPFTQFNNPNFKKQPGTGLGLAISRSLAELMNGEMNVQSRLQKGSVFSVKFPLATVQANKEQITTIENATSSQEESISCVQPPLVPLSTGQSPLFILIEENETIRQVLQNWIHDQEDCNIAIFKDLLDCNEYLKLNLIATSKIKIFLFISRNYLLDQITEQSLLLEIKQGARSKVASLSVCLLTLYGENDPIQDSWLSMIDYHFTQPVQSWSYSRMFEDLNQGRSQQLGWVSERFKDQEKKLKNMRLLIVEDNAVNQIVAEGILSKQGAEVVKAENGEEALHWLKMNSHNMVDVILMDLQMPILDGFETCRQIRNQDHLKLIPVIAITAHLDEQERARCQSVGMSDYLSKPFDPEDLIQKILNLARPIHKLDFIESEEQSKLNKERLDKPCAIDWSMARRHSGDNESLLREVLNRFIRDFASADIQLKNHFLKVERIQFERLYYSFRALIYFIGATNLKLRLEELEVNYQNKDTQMIFNQLELISKELSLVVNEIFLFLKKSSRAVDCELNI